jgi:5-hydroxyisourate hydrolase-like protein (transthyretin family)
MTKYQESKINSIETLILFCDQQAGITESLPEFNPNLSDLKETIAEIKAVGEKQKTGLTGIAVDKKQLRSRLISLGSDSARKLSSYAKLKKQNTLLVTIDFTVSDFNRFSDIELRDHAQIVYDAAQGILPELGSYFINEETQAELQSAIYDFNNSMNAPRLGTTAKSQLTQQLVVLFKRAEVAEANMNASVELIRTSNPDFYNGYQTAGKVIRRGLGSLAVKVLVTEAQTNNPIEGVTVTFTPVNGTSKLSQASGNRTGLVKKTAAKGGFNIKSLESGTYQVSFQKPGYTEITQEVNVINGELIVVNAAMEKK